MCAVALGYIEHTLGLLVNEDEDEDMKKMKET